ncbi:hypothetical protein FJT64_004927 [Amphibalanus amphitrite]|uniref:Reverse transcriptase domain-containing protein n=1 Tax=Amphibalanus amphitrite TaxID=1232801 RepID=A0A6A4VVA0_AMPAM|nr:hypothetical protein FJT64_004927 [Amphibalanus amphitrite]
MGYVTMDQAIAALFEVGPDGALMTKADLKHAFRLIPVMPEQWWHLGFRWKDQFYFDMRLPFGLRSACAIFNDLAQVLRDAAASHSYNPHVNNYLDDFFFFSSASSPLCDAAYQTFLSLCETCGVPTAPDKCQAPSTRMELLGCVLDTVSLTISLPDRKVRDIIAGLRAARGARKLRQRDLLSLIGKLVHATKCIPAGRTKLFAKAHALPEGKPSGLSRKMPSRLKSVTGWRGVGHETWRAAGIALRLDLARWLHASAPPWEVAAFPDFTFRLDIGTLQRDASADELHLTAQRQLATLPSKPSGIRTRGAARLFANANAFSEDNPPKATMAKPRHRAGYRLTA